MWLCRMSCTRFFRPLHEVLAAGVDDLAHRGGVAQQRSCSAPARRSRATARNCAWPFSRSSSLEVSIRLVELLLRRPGRSASGACRRVALARPDRRSGGPSAPARAPTCPATTWPAPSVAAVVSRPSCAGALLITLSSDLAASATSRGAQPDQRVDRQRVLAGSATSSLSSLTAAMRRCRSMALRQRLGCGATGVAARSPGGVSLALRGAASRRWRNSVVMSCLLVSPRGVSSSA